MSYNPQNINAFPSDRSGQTGMTLRDYFAGQALVALPNFWPAETRARVSYEFADAMLEERLKLLTGQLLN